MRQVAKRKGKPLRRQATGVQTAGELSKNWLEKLKQDAEADPDGPRAKLLKAHRDAKNASMQVRREKLRKVAEADPASAAAQQLKAQRDQGSAWARKSRLKRKMLADAVAAAAAGACKRQQRAD